MWRPTETPASTGRRDFLKTAAVAGAVAGATPGKFGLAPITPAQAQTTGLPNDQAHPVRLDTRYGYDLRDRRGQVIEAVGDDNLERTTTTAYDKVGNPTEVTDPERNIVRTANPGTSQITTPSSQPAIRDSPSGLKTRS